MDDTDSRGRKILRQEGDVLMWQEYIDGPHRDTGQLLRYFVGRAQGPSKSFTAPHHAFDHFRQITGTAEGRAKAPAAPKRRPEGG
jgi:hypothetical protein